MNKTIGYISYTHGLDGKIKIVPMVKNHEFEEYIRNNYDIYLKTNEKQKIKLSIFAFNGKVFLCKIDGINNIEEAKKIIKNEIFVETTYEEDYIDPEVLLNFDVFLENDNNLYGQIIDYGNYGAGELLEIKLKKNGKSEFYQCNKQNILKIDMGKQCIFLKKQN